MSNNISNILWLIRRSITAVDASGALNSVGNFSVATNKLTVAAASGNTAIAGDVAVATNKFTVASASGNTVVAGTLGVTSDVAVNTNKFTVAASSGNTVVAGTLGVTGVATFTADIAAAGGFRAMVGPFTAPGAAGVTAASQTNLDMRYEHTVTAAALSFVATRAGSIMGISGHLSAAITGAGTTITIAATKNGTEVALTAAFSQAGGEVTKTNTAAKDALTFAAGDILGISYTSTGISNTPALVATLEIES